jgi:uncharacterized protein YjbI with pentapeptide repeats
MACPQQLEILKQGVAVWNQWRIDDKSTQIDLRDAELPVAKLDGVDFSNAFLANANLRRANLKEANFANSHLLETDLGEANLSKTNFTQAAVFNSNLHDANLADANFEQARLTSSNFSGANLRRANLKNADLSWTSLVKANLQRANLCGADLSYSNLVETKFNKANLSDCSIYGISAWGVRLYKTKQNGLRITPDKEPALYVDNLEVAQFVYLLLNNKNIRQVITTIGQKAILILGRFIPERKEILDSIAEALRQRGYLPIIFDFESSQERDFTETIKILAGLSLFVIADMTNPKSNPLELQATVPDYMIPFLPLIQEGENPFSMFVDLQQKYSWILPILKYDTKESLLAGIDEAIIKPALKKHDELISRKAEALKSVHIKDYLPNGT